MADKPESKPLAAPPRELELDEKQEFYTDLARLEALLRRYARFSEWLARNGRAT